MNIIDQIKHKNIEELQKDSVALMQIESILEQRNAWKKEEPKEEDSQSAQSLIDSVE